MAKLETPSTIESGMDDEHVKEALDLISKNSDTHNEKETIWRAIQALFEGAFVISNPSGTKVISSKLLLQILWKVVNKMKIPDFKIYKAGPFKLTTDKELEEEEATIRDWSEQLVTAGVSTVMKEGRFIQCMRDKGGAFFKMSLFGDAHVHIGYDEDNSDYPITFKVSSLSDYWVNNDATDIRDPVGGLGADGDVMIYRYTKKQFDRLFPDFANKVACGEIPKNETARKQLEKTWKQAVNDSDIIETAIYTSIDGVQVTFAGPACTVLKKYEGEEFPSKLDGKNEIPTLHFKFFPSSEGYYNYGIGHMVYDIALLASQMDDMAYKHAGDNIWPITLINSATKSPSKLFNELLKAQEARDAGGRGYVVSENQGGTAGVSVESFQSDPITQEWERAFTRLETQIRRLGFELDAPDLGSSPNEMSIMSAQENADAPIKQIIEYNASEFEMAVRFTMQFIREFVDDDDQTPLNSMVDLEAGDRQVPLRGIPLGWVARELKKNRYFVVVNSRDGTIPSNVMELAKARETVSMLPQGTPAWNKMAVKIAKLNGHNVTAEELAMGQPAGPAGMPEGGAIPTETTPLSPAQLKYGK